jgi:hypothetical protein
MDDSASAAAHALADGIWYPDLWRDREAVRRFAPRAPPGSDVLLEEDVAGLPSALALAPLASQHVQLRALGGLIGGLVMGALTHRQGGSMTSAVHSGTEFFLGAMDPKPAARARASCARPLPCSPEDAILAMGLGSALLAAEDAAELMMRELLPGAVMRPRIVWRFWHPLVRSAPWRGLDASPGSPLHERVEALAEGLYPDRHGALRDLLRASPGRGETALAHAGWAQAVASCWAAARRLEPEAFPPMAVEHVAAVWGAGCAVDRVDLARNAVVLMAPAAPPSKRRH